MSTLLNPVFERFLRETFLERADSLGFKGIEGYKVETSLVNIEKDVFACIFQAPFKTFERNAKVVQSWTSIPANSEEEELSKKIEEKISSIEEMIPENLRDHYSISLEHTEIGFWSPGKLSCALVVQLKITFTDYLVQPDLTQLKAFLSEGIELGALKDSALGQKGILDIILEGYMPKENAKAIQRWLSILNS